jgi:uncharacterized protein (TIGR03086 family)
MSEAVPHYEIVSNRFDRVLRGVLANQWELSTPCELWTSRQLVAHVIETHRRAVATLGDDPYEEVRDDDVIDAWTNVNKRVLDVRNDSSRSQQIVSGLGRDQSFASLVEGLLTFDTLCHTWDLARATGQDEALDPDAVRYAHAALTPFSEAIRNPGGFAPALESSGDASAQTQFLNFTGRRV